MNEEKYKDNEKKREWIIDTCYHMHETWTHAKWKKPVIEDNILYDFLHMICPEQGNL